MLYYCFQKLSYAFLTLFGVVTVIFFLFTVLPGDPARMMLDQREDSEQMDLLRKKYGFDQPISVQYLNYLNDLSPISYHKDLNNYTVAAKLSIGEGSLVLKTPYLRTSFQKGDKTPDGQSLHYKDKEDVWIINREYWTGYDKTPTKLPAEIIKKILQYSSEKTDLILDPFLGSGQVAVVSKMLGRKYLGFEIVKQYYNFASKRLQKNVYRLQKEIRT